MREPAIARARRAIHADGRDVQLRVLSGAAGHQPRLRHRVGDDEPRRTVVQRQPVLHPAMDRISRERVFVADQREIAAHRARGAFEVFLRSPAEIDGLALDAIRAVGPDERMAAKVLWRLRRESSQVVSEIGPAAIGEIMGGDIGSRYRREPRRQQPASGLLALRADEAAATAGERREVVDDPIRSPDRFHDRIAFRHRCPSVGRRAGPPARPSTPWGGWRSAPPDPRAARRSPRSAGRTGRRSWRRAAPARPRR